MLVAVGSRSYSRNVARFFQRADGVYVALGSTSCFLNSARLA